MALCSRHAAWSSSSAVLTQSPAAPHQASHGASRGLAGSHTHPVCRPPGPSANTAPARTSVPGAPPERHPEGARGGASSLEGPGISTPSQHGLSPETLLFTHLCARLGEPSVRLQMGNQIRIKGHAFCSNQGKCPRTTRANTGRGLVAQTVFPKIKTEKQKCATKSRETRKTC